MASMGSLISLRTAVATDLLALTAVRPPEAIHRGRLRDAQRSDFDYLVILHGQAVIGFSCLVFRRPPSWSNVHDHQCLPQIVDLYVTEAHRGQGVGSEAIHLLERMAAERGSQQLFISVDPLANPRAYQLYQRLGYQPIQSEPYFHRWASLNGDGQIERGEDWLIDMVKALDR